MTYDETGSGGLTVEGCGLATLLRNNLYVERYRAGNILYAAHRARKGVLEKVVIKKVSGYLYTDTLNGIWNEEDLVEFDDAVVLVETYIARQEALIALLGCQTN